MNSDDGAATLPYRRSRPEQSTRREAFEQRFGRRGLEEKKDETDAYVENLAGSDAEDDDDDCNILDPQSPVTDPLQSPSAIDKCTPRTSTTVTTSTEEYSYQSLSDVLGQTAYFSPTEADDCIQETLPIPNRPLHFPSHDPPLKYYRIVYKGVATILTRPEVGAPRSGSYVSYGEVFCSTSETIAKSTSNCEHRLHPRTNRFMSAGQSDDTIHTASESTSIPPTMPFLSADGNTEDGSALPSNVFIRVDRVLTGGYAMDSLEKAAMPPAFDAETPRRTNAQFISFPSESRVQEERLRAGKKVTPRQDLGYILMRQNVTDIVEELESTPISEAGRFLYQITSSSPLPILTGPSLDAPKTKAMLLPGTVHEVSLRILLDPENEGVYFLRLSHRRGWIADRKPSRSYGGRGSQSVPVVNELPVEGHQGGDDSTASFSAMSSVAISSVSAATTGLTRTRMRHRPPRRNRDGGKASLDKALPRQVLSGSGSLTPATTQVKAKRAEDSQIMSPTSNVSMMSEDSTDQEGNQRQRLHPTQGTMTSQVSRSTAWSTTAPTQQYFLIRVTAPGGLKVLDAPQTQVNNLIHRKHIAVSSSHSVSTVEGPKSHKSIFQTMSSRLTTTGPSATNSAAIFDSSSRTRILPRGALFEASRRMEGSGGYTQGAGLIKLSDNSGWAIIPRQDDLEKQHRDAYGAVGSGHDSRTVRAFEEVGNAVIDGGIGNPMESSVGAEEQPDTVWLRVYSRGGAQVACPPPMAPRSPEVNEAASITSRGSSAVNDDARASSKDSDVASSVGSSFLDAMFRTPKKGTRNGSSLDQIDPIHHEYNSAPSVWSGTIACGMIVEVERCQGAPSDQPKPTFMRLRGGQGWIPTEVSGKVVAVKAPRPETRYGSFWFRVQSTGGIKVRLGPSTRNSSIMSEEGVYFRFECGEFLRASEVMTVLNEAGEPVECFAKLYRDRHVRLHDLDQEFRSFSSLTGQSEWVSVYDEEELFLEECASEPRIERLKGGWRYTVVPECQIQVRHGPSFAAGKSGVTLFGNDTLVATERVRPAGEKITWLRLKDGSGWIHDLSEKGEPMIVAQTLRHNKHVHNGGAPMKQKRTDRRDEIAYNTIIARLFHNDDPNESHRAPNDLKGFGYVKKSTISF